MGPRRSRLHHVPGAGAGANRSTRTRSPRMPGGRANLSLPISARRRDDPKQSTDTLTDMELVAAVKPRARLAAAAIERLDRRVAIAGLGAVNWLVGGGLAHGIPHNRWP